MTKLQLSLTNSLKRRAYSPTECQGYTENKMNSSEKNYEKIINRPHHVSQTHKPMSAINRAAQFSPFAALTGLDDAVCETARLTDEKLELDEDMSDKLNSRLKILSDSFTEATAVSVTYFVPDPNKAGGAYVTFGGEVRRIDEYNRTIVFTDGTVIAIDDVFCLEGEIFRAFEKDE